MIRKIYPTRVVMFLIAAALLIVPTTPRAASSSSPAPFAEGEIDADGYFAADKAQRGRTTQAAIVLNIPGGLHINANRLRDKTLIPTTVKIEAPRGVRVSPVAYPRAIVRRLSFSKDSMQLFEGRQVLRFNVTVPANYGDGRAELKATVHYQSCNDRMCFPPRTREVWMRIDVVGANETVKRKNEKYFGRR